jgi:hypothetical protein
VTVALMKGASNVSDEDWMTDDVLPPPATWTEVKIARMQKEENRLWLAMQALIPEGEVLPPYPHTPEYEAASKAYWAVRNQREALARDYAVLSMHPDDRFPVHPRFITVGRTKKQKRRNAWMEEVSRRLRERAAFYAGGDEKLTMCLYGNMQYNMSMVPDMPYMREDGAGWWQVGRNASHEFYLGFLADGSFARASCGEEGEDEDGYPIDKWHQRALAPGEAIGYIGHG